MGKGLKVGYRSFFRCSFNLSLSSLTVTAFWCCTPPNDLEKSLRALFPIPSSWSSERSGGWPTDCCAACWTLLPNCCPIATLPISSKKALTSCWGKHWSAAEACSYHILSQFNQRPKSGCASCRSNMANFWFDLVPQIFCMTILTFSSQWQLAKFRCRQGIVIDQVNTSFFAWYKHGGPIPCMKLKFSM